MVIYLKYNFTQFDGHIIFVFVISSICSPFVDHFGDGHIIFIFAFIFVFVIQFSSPLVGQILVILAVLHHHRHRFLHTYMYEEDDDDDDIYT